MYDIILKRSSHFKLLSEKVGRARSCKAVTTWASTFLPPFYEPHIPFDLVEGRQQNVVPVSSLASKGGQTKHKSFIKTQVLLREFM